MKITIQSPKLVLLKQPENTTHFRKALVSLLKSSNPFASSEKSSDQKESSVLCCICLSGIGPFQALFLSPCSHCFHYKCIRHVLLENGQMFPCPVCRQVANLEASVSMESLCDFDVESEEDDKRMTLEEEFKIGKPSPFQLALGSSEIKCRRPLDETSSDFLIDTTLSTQEQ